MLIAFLQESATETKSLCEKYKPSSYKLSRNAYKLPLKYTLTSIMLFASCFINIQNSFSQTNNAIRLREQLPSVVVEKLDPAPGYCPSEGGSTTFEKITNVHVLEKPGNLLDITVDVFIANPTGCKTGEPCPVYDTNPENVNVWIDWNGNKVWEPHEKVLDAALTSYNISYGKNMIAKASVEIPANAVRPTYLRANLGWGFDPEDPCRFSWSFGNVVDDQILWNMKVADINATLNVEMQDVPKPLWQATYDEYGNPISIISNAPIAAGMKNGFFTLPVNLISFPGTLGDDSNTECDWEVVGTGINGLAGIVGKSGVISVSLPQKIGIYELKLKFKFKNNLNNRIGEQIISLPLWVSYDKPQLPIKKIWLQKAIEWTQGTQMNSTIEDELAQKIMDGIYSKSGWQYYTYNFNWSKLVEGLETAGANCHVMANIWLNLLKTLGVGGVSTVTHSGEVNNKGFMVVPGVKAFGSLPSANGNASKDYTVYPTYDRWIFAGHTFGKKGNTFYDPTFNITGVEKYFHVAHDILGETDGIIYTNAGGPTVWRNGSAVFEEGWNKYIYKYSTLEKSISSHKKVNLDVRFTGSFAEVLVDNNNDGIFDQLAGTVGIEITNPGKYIVTGFLKKDENFITSQPYYAAPVNWFESIGPQAGLIEVQALFSGERIFSEGLNGPFTIKLSITDSTGTVADTAMFNTTSLVYQQFGELPTRILNISENAVDTSGDGLFDVILSEFSIDASQSGNYSIQTTLFHDSQLLVTENRNITLGIGNNQLNFSLDAKPISNSELNGPYSLAVQVIDSGGEQSAYKEIQTSNYSASQFNPPTVKITGGNSDQGIDINSNGLYDTLKVSLNVEAAESGTFKILAWLMGQNGENINLAETWGTISIGTNAVMLNFPGENINKSQIDGPYKIGYAVISDDSSNLIYSGTDLYTTQTYSASQFEESKGQIISSTGNYSESSIDTDKDGLIDTLIVKVEVVPRDSGTVVALGRLVDSENETILWSSTAEFLHENIPQWLDIKFDGRYIYGGLVDGPYQLKDLQIYHVGDPSQTIDFPAPYTTQNYNYTDFEKTGLITGTISDVNNDPVKNAFVIISNTDNDYSSSTGKYNLILLNAGEFDLRIEGPDTLNIDWQIFVNGSLVSSGDSVRVSVDTNQIVNVDFKAPIIISDVGDKYSTIIPEKYFLKQNFPNPFNPITEIVYRIPKSSNVLLTIYDLLGNKIAELVNEVKLPGEYKLTFDGSNLTSGVYFYRLQAAEFVSTRKFVLMK